MRAEAEAEAESQKKLQLDLLKPKTRMGMGRPVYNVDQLLKFMVLPLGRSETGSPRCQLVGLSDH